MKKTTKKPAAKAATKPAGRQPVRVQIEIRHYPHVAHVHRDGIEDPKLRRMHATAAEVQDMADTWRALPGHVVTVQAYNANGQPVA